MISSMRNTTYERMPQRELSKRFEEYCEKDWKGKSEAAKILGYIHSVNEIKRIYDKIIKLAKDKNLATRLNLMSSIKKIVLKHHIVTEDMFVLLYLWANSSNKTTSEFAKEIIDSINPNILVKYIVELSLKLYSRDMYEKAYATVALGLISAVTPEHITNTLPEIVLMASTCKHKILQMFAVEILDDFRDMNKEYLTELFFSLYIARNSGSINLTHLDVNNINEEELLKYITYVYFKKTISKDDILKIIIGLETNDSLIKSLTLATLYQHYNVFKEIINENQHLKKQIMERTVGFFNSSEWILRISAMYLFMKFLLSNNVDDEEYISIFFNTMLENFKDNHIVKGFSLEILYKIYDSTQLDSLKDKISEIINKIDLGTIMCECHLCYYNGLYLANKLNKYDYFSAKYCPNIDNNLIEEFKEMDTEEYVELIKSLNASLDKKYWLAGWVNRLYVGKYLGNMLYVRPGYASNVFNMIKSLINDNNYMVRNVGIWILRLTVEHNIKPPQDILYKSTYLINDWYFGNRAEYVLYYYTLLEKFPDIIENEYIKSKLASTLILKYMVDKNKFVREVCEKILDNNGNIGEYPDIEKFKNYYKLDIPERIELLEKFWKIPELRKTVVIMAKVRFKILIKKKDYSTINAALKKIFEEKMYEDKEMEYLLPELIILKEEFETAKKIINEFKNRYPLLSKDLESVMVHTINETIISIRTKGLKELLLFVKEGFLITNNLLDRVKEITVYECVSMKNINLALSILRKINDLESRELVREKVELMEYLKKPLNLEKIEKESIADLDWKDSCVKISYIPTIGAINLFTNDSIKETMDSFVKVLNLENRVILKIMMIDLLIEEVAKNDEFLINLLDNKMLFITLFNIGSDEKYHLLSKKARILFEKLSLKGENWLKGQLINYIKHANQSEVQKIVENIIILLKKELSVYTKMELLNSLEYALDNNLIKFDRKLTYALVDVLENITNDQPWILFKKTTDLIFSGHHIGENKELLERVLSKFISYGEASKDKKHYIAIYIKKLLTSSKYDFTKINEDVFEKLVKFENSWL